MAVLDTGIDAAHAAFAGVSIVERDFTGEGNGDQHGHGTHCAGTIFGRDVQNTRIGVAPGVTKAFIGKVLGTNGGASDEIVNAIQWAVDQGAHVISMSLGMDFPGFVDFLVNTEGLVDPGGHDRRPGRLPAERHAVRAAVRPGDGHRPVRPTGADRRRGGQRERP